MYKEDFGELYELRLESKASGTAALTQEDLNTLIADAFAKAGESEVLAEEVTVRSQRPFPVTGGAVFLVWFRKAIAFDIFKRRVLPKLEERFAIWWTKKPTPEAVDQSYNKSGP